MTAPTYGRRRGDRQPDELASDLAAAEARVEECGYRERIARKHYDAALANTMRTVEPCYRMLREAILDGEQARRAASRCRHRLRELEQVSA